MLKDIGKKNIPKTMTNVADKVIVYMIRWWGVDGRGKGYASVIKINGQHTVKGTKSMLWSMSNFTNAQ